MDGLKGIKIHFKLPCEHCGDEMEYDLLEVVTYGGANRPRRCVACNRRSVLRQHPRFKAALEHWAEFSALIVPESPISKKVKEFLRRMRRAEEVRANAQTKTSTAGK